MRESRSWRAAALCSAIGVSDQLEIAGAARALKVWRIALLQVHAIALKIIVPVRRLGPVRGGDRGRAGAVPAPARAS
jgi:hypothetical protein